MTKKLATGRKKMNIFFKLISLFSLSIELRRMARYIAACATYFSEIIFPHLVKNISNMIMDTVVAGSPINKVQRKGT